MANQPDPNPFGNPLDPFSTAAAINRQAAMNQMMKEFGWAHASITPSMLAAGQAQREAKTATPTVNVNV